MRRLLLALIVPLSSACVMQSTYDALQKDFDDTKASMNGQLSEKDRAIAEKDRRNQDLSEALKREQLKSADLAEQITRLQNQFEALQRSKGDLEVEHASMLRDKQGLQDSVVQMKNALAELARRKAEADARIAEFKGLLDRFKTLIDAGKLKVKMADGQMVVELASDVLFSSGSANLSKDGSAAIGEVAGLLASIPNRKFQIQGHTDNIPIHSAQYPSNWELAAARSLTVLKTMVESGMPNDRISAASYGDAKPAKANDTPEGRAANRRIEIVVVPDLSSLPGFDELNTVTVAK